MRHLRYQAFTLHRSLRLLVDGWHEERLLFLLVEDQVTNVKCSSSSKHIIKRCIYEHAGAVNYSSSPIVGFAFLSGFWRSALGIGVWLNVFSKPVLQGLFPAAPVSLTSNALLFSLPAGFACSRLLLHWKTDRFQGFLLYWVF